MQFWVERHVVDRPSRKIYEIPNAAAEFDGAFAGYEDDDDGAEGVLDG